MDNKSSRGSAMACSSAPGFTLTELLISIAMMTLLATFTVTSLYSSQRKEEVVTAARVLAADIRALQTRALTAQNVKTCSAAGVNITCETGSSSCDVPASCAPAPPYAVGAYFQSGLATYPFFADVDVTHKDGQDTPSAGEEFFTRSFITSGSAHVVISSLFAGTTTTETHVSFARQNGIMSIYPCTGACPSVTTLRITLTQQQSGDTATVSLNAITGRVSID